jgi:hypothetical protein
MVGTDAAGAQQTDLSTGKVTFPSASLPCDLHVFSPSSGGSAQYSPSVASYYHCTQSPFTFKIFNSSTYCGTYYTSVTATGAGSLTEWDNMFSSNRLVSTGGTSGGGSVGISASIPCTPYADSVYMCGLGYDASGNLTSALFYPPTFVFNGTLLSGYTSSSGYTLGTLAINPTGAGWTDNQTQVYVGPSSTGFWLGGQTVYGPFGAGSLSFAYPSGTAFYRTVYWASSTGQYFQEISDFSSPPSALAVSVLPSPSVVAVPSSASRHLSGTNNSAIVGDVWSASLYASSGSWEVYQNGAAPGTSLDVVLPSVFPAAVPPSYPFASGAYNLWIEVVKTATGTFSPAVLDTNSYYGNGAIYIAKGAPSSTW